MTYTAVFKVFHHNNLQGYFKEHLEAHSDEEARYIATLDEDELTNEYHTFVFTDLYVGV